MDNVEVPVRVVRPGEGVRFDKRGQRVKRRVGVNVVERGVSRKDEFEDFPMNKRHGGSAPSFRTRKRAKGEWLGEGGE